MHEAVLHNLQARATRDQAEVDEIQSALHSIEGDAYFQTVTARYFNGAADCDVSELCIAMIARGEGIGRGWYGLSQIVCRRWMRYETLCDIIYNIKFCEDTQ